MPDARHDGLPAGIVTLAGGGELGEAALGAARAIGPALVAADGGAHGLRALGHMPARIIGDLDSLGPRAPWEAAGVEITHVTEQDSTDFEKCLAAIGPVPLVLAVGFTGGRLDHLMATLTAMGRADAPPVILVGPEDITFRAPPTLALDLPAGCRVSLWPLAPVTVTRCEGLVWDATGLAMAPLGRVGTSNAATGGTLRLAFSDPGMFVVLPVDRLAQVARALTAAG